MKRGEFVNENMNEKQMVHEYYLAMEIARGDASYYNTNEFREIMARYQESDHFNERVKVHYRRRAKLRTDSGFTQSCKNKVKSRDNFKCQECGRRSSRFGYYKGLDVHHIDGNPTNNCLDNLITLCRSCHNRYTLKQ